MTNQTKPQAEAQKPAGPKMYKATQKPGQKGPQLKKISPNEAAFVNRWCGSMSAADQAMHVLELTQSLGALAEVVRKQEAREKARESRILKPH